MQTIRSRLEAPLHLYPFHHVEVDDYWNGVYSGWRSVFAEMLGVMCYVFASAGLSIATNTFDIKEPDFHRTLLINALGDGFAFMAFLFATQKLSGAHLNPVTTWAALITRRIGLLRGIAYMIAQVGGALVGALLIAAATPDNYHGRLGSSFWDENLTRFDGFLLITVLTSFLIFVVFATQYDPQNIGKLAPLPIGITIIFINLVAYVFVGPAVNPARVLATAIVNGSYHHMWVYWVAPFIGSSIAALTYVLLFLTREFPVVDVLATGAPMKYSSNSAAQSETTRLMSGTPAV